MIKKIKELKEQYFPKKVKLPVWLAMFSGEPKESFDEEFLRKVAEDLAKGKDVVFLVDSKPYIVKYKNEKITGEFIEHYKYTMD